MPATIDYYFTSASPFVYLGHKALMDVAAAHFANDRELFRLEVNHIDASHDDIVPGCAGSREGEAQVFERLLGLKFEVAFADDLAAGIDGSLAGDVNGLPAGGGDDVSPAVGFAKGRRVQELVGHVIA